jgi:hypothetical protein
VDVEPLEVYVLCPITGALTNTGISMVPEIFDLAQVMFRSWSFRCQYCGNMHQYDRRDVHTNVAGRTEPTSCI